MKKYLTVLLATIALPVFGSAYPNGVTQIGDPYAGRIYLGLDPIVQVNEGARTQEVFLTYESVLPGIVNLNWTSFTNLDPGIPNAYVEYGVFRAPHGTRVPNTQTDNEGVASSYTPAQLSTNIPPWEWVSTTGPAYGGGLLANTFQLTDVNASTQTDYWIYPIIQVGNPMTNFSDATYPMSSNYNVICIGCQTVNTNPGALLWETNSVMDAGNSMLVLSVAVDRAGGSAAAGWFSGVVTVGTNVLNSGSTLNVNGVIVRYDNSGNVVWVKQLSEAPVSNNGVECMGIAFDSQTNILVTGYFTKTVDFGGGNVTFSGGSGDPADIFVAKYTSAGAFVWVKTPTGQLDDRGVSVCVDTNDDVIAAAQFMSSPLDFGGGKTLNDAGVFNVALAKLSKTDGSCTWLSQIGGGNSQPYAVCSDTNGNVFVGGGFYNGSLAKFNSAGTLQWTRSGGTVYGVAADPLTGNVVATGVRSQIIFLKGYNSAGETNWLLENYTADGGSEGRSVAFDNGGNLAFTGKDVSGVYFGGPSIAQGNGTANMFINSFSTSGTNTPTWRWTKQLGFGTTGSSGGNGIAFDSSGNIIVGGWFGYLTDFGGKIVIAPSGQNWAFTASYRN